MSRLNYHHHHHWYSIKCMLKAMHLHLSNNISTEKQVHLLIIKGYKKILVPMLRFVLLGKISKKIIAEKIQTVDDISCQNDIFSAIRNIIFKIVQSMVVTLYG